MIWWFVIVVVVSSLLILVMAALPLLRRLDQLGIAARRLLLRVADVERLQPAVIALQQRAERMQQEVAVLGERSERMQGGHKSTGR